MTTALKTTVQRKGTVRTTEHGPYYRYQDPDTHRTIVCIHQEPGRYGWRASTPGSHSEHRTTLTQATNDANEILKSRGYAPINTPAP